MCGIVAVVGRPSSRRPPAAPEVRRALRTTIAALEAAVHGPGTGPEDWLGAVQTAAAGLEVLDRQLRGVPGLACLMGGHALVGDLEAGTVRLDELVGRLEATLDSGEAAAGGPGRGPEELNAALVGLRDVAFALSHDRLGAYRDVSALCRSLGLAPAPHVLGVLWAVHAALRSLDRLEVRGRDSAGLHLMLSGHGLVLDGDGGGGLPGDEGEAALWCSGAARSAEGCLSLVYKTAAEIGELGDNVAALRRAIAQDRLLAQALESPEVRATVVGHTRWASVGLVNEPNAHPLNSEETGPDGGPVRRGPYVVGALNGDIDNYSAIVSSSGMALPPEVTTDAKVVPVLVSRRLATGMALGDAFRSAVADFEGSVGIAVNCSSAPGDVYLALRGSGQGLNVGLAEDAFVVASEVYGLAEETRSYLRLDGEDGGQVVRCSRDGAGELAGLWRAGYDGRELPIEGSELRVAEITTRDVDRRGYRHFLLKELHEAPGSVRKTLRGKVAVGADGGLVARLGEATLAPSLVEALRQGRVAEVLVIGQGTAAVAGQAVASAIARALPRSAVKALPATELSGWGPAGLGLPDDLSATLVVAISQSGTTTDTNRTVDLARGRGAHVVAIVNRRNSDLVQKSHGVLYTSDGRDVEMSVASTKAFYSQVVAGHLLALGLAAAAEGSSPGPAGAEARGARAQEVLSALRELPSQLEAVLARRSRIGRVAAAVAPSRRSWAVVGSGPDRVAAAEVRIKLSELCYKAIACDAIEDKKHIDLSAEPMVLVCAASAGGANAQDIYKETLIFRAHRAAPVVVVPESEEGRFASQADVITVPSSHPELAFVLAAMVGHIFGYEAALAIDGLARPLREARAILEEPEARRLDLAGMGPRLLEASQPALAGLRSGSYDGCLNASTAARLVALLRYATGSMPVEGYEAEMGKVGTPAAITSDLLSALTTAIDELTRPIDAIKHQAKTVTVGISRSEQALLGAPLVLAALGAGASAGSLGYRALRALAALGPAVEQVVGFTRYQVRERPGPGSGEGLAGATIDVVDQGGIARGLVSRTATDNTLRGTKHRTADKREVTAFRGLHDGRTGLMVPELKDGHVTGLTLLHARFAPFLEPAAAKAVLQAYQGRYAALVDAVTEVRPSFDDSVLGTVPVVDLLTEPVVVLARHWST